jgi:hypothetical protein
MRLVQTLLAIAATALAQSAPDAVLERARVRIQELTKRLDRYVCVETVDRSYFSPAPTSGPPAEPRICAATPPTRLEEEYELVSTDRLRVEVTVSQSRELHSWPGATGFDTRDIDQLIANGPVSTGSFALYLSTIFGRPGVIFQYKGEEVAADGRKRFRYQYRAPVETSGFKLRAGGAWLPAGFEGEFRIDPDTLALDVLTVRASDPPAETGLCGVASTLQYHTLQIGDGTVILPRRSQLEILYRNGQASRNDTMFGNCREYQAESELLFDAPAGEADAAAGRTGRARVALPLGLPVTLALQDPIDSDSAATGDPVSARVVKAVRRPGAKEVLIPAGTIVHGRIRRMEHHFLPEPYFLVSMAFNRMELQGALAPFAARHEPDGPLARELDAQLGLRATGIWFWNVGTFLFRSEQSRYTIPAGFESQWFTLAIGGPTN